MELARKHQSEALAAHLRALRTERGMTLQQLADQSGVSRATLSRIENDDVSPTAETLGRLASALVLPISRLLAPMEHDFPPLVRVDAQSVWRDPETGFVRRSLSPPSRQLAIELIEGDLPPRTRIAYDAPAVPAQEHHLVMLSGALSVTVDGVGHDLQAGDCLRYKLQGPSVFLTGDQGARYMIALF